MSPLQGPVENDKLNGDDGDFRVPAGGVSQFYKGIPIVDSAMLVCDGNHDDCRFTHWLHTMRFSALSNRQGVSGFQHWSIGTVCLAKSK